MRALPAFAASTPRLVTHPYPSASKPQAMTRMYADAICQAPSQRSKKKDPPATAHPARRGQVRAPAPCQMATFEATIRSTKDFTARHCAVQRPGGEGALIIKSGDIRRPRPEW